MVLSVWSVVNSPATLPVVLVYLLALQVDLPEKNISFFSWKNIFFSHKIFNFLLTKNYIFFSHKKKFFLTFVFLGGSGPNSLSPGGSTQLPGAPGQPPVAPGQLPGAPGQLPGAGAQLSGNEMRFGGTELVMLYDYKVPEQHDHV